MEIGLKANQLTNAIEEFIRYGGNYCDRVNNVGIFDPRTRRYRKANTRLGIVDIFASKLIEHQGRKFAVMVAIEVKVGKDRLSTHQKAMQEEIERKGGYYLIARTFDSFVEQWNLIS